MITVYDIDKVKAIGEDVKTALIAETGLDIKIKYANDYRVIAIQNDSIELWLRLYPGENDKYNADISTIWFDESLRRKGLFEFMCRGLKKCQYINKLKITSVCTYEMRNWCEKHKLEEVSPSDYLVEF